MPLYSIEKWRAAVGAMASLAARRRQNQKIREEKEFQKRKTSYNSSALLLALLLLSQSACPVDHPNVITPVDSRGTRQISGTNNRAQNSPTKKQGYSLSTSYLLHLLSVSVLILAIFLTAVSPFIVEMLLMMSGDVEPNPGPTVLTSDDLRYIVTALADAQHKWYQIGVQLSVRVARLDCIASEYQRETSECLLHMLKEWLTSIDPTPSWEALVDVLCNRAVHLQDVAKEIRDKYCSEHKLPSEKPAGRRSGASMGEGIPKRQIDTIPYVRSKLLEGPKWFEKVSVVDYNMGKKRKSELPYGEAAIPCYENMGTPEKQPRSEIVPPNITEELTTGISFSSKKGPIENPLSQSENERTDRAMIMMTQLQPFFEKLLSRTCDVVRTVEPQTFNSALLSLPSDRKWNARFDMKMLVPKLGPFTPIATVLEQLSSHFNFQDSSLVAIIIKILQNDQLDQHLQEYISNLDVFKCSIGLPTFALSRKGRKEIKVVFFQNFHVYRYKDVEDLKLLLTSYCSLPSFIIIFQYIDQQSKRATFLTVTAIARLLSYELSVLPEESHRHLGQFARYVSIGGMTCYHQKYNKQQDMRTEIERVQTKFLSLQEETEFQIEKLDASDFFRKLTTLPVCHHWHRDFIINELFPVRNDVSMLWILVKFYINFLNHSLLEHIIKITKNRQLMEEMEEYQHDIDVFRSRTKLCDFIDYWPRPDAQPPETQLQEIVKLKIDKPWEECTLRDLEEARQTLTSRFFLPDFAVFLETVYKSSVHMCLLTTTNVLQIMQTTMIEGIFPDQEDVILSSLTLKDTEYQFEPTGNAAQEPRSCKSTLNQDEEVLDIKEEVKKELPREDTLEVKKELPREDTLEVKKELPREDTLEVKKELPREDTLEVKKELPREDTLEVKKELPREDTLEVKKELPREDTLEVKKELPHEDTLKAKKKLPREDTLEAKKELPREDTLEVKKELPRENTLEVMKELPREDTLEVKKELPREDTLEVKMKAESLEMKYNKLTSEMFSECEDLSPVFFCSSLGATDIGEQEQPSSLITKEWLPRLEVDISPELAWLFIKDHFQHLTNYLNYHLLQDAIWKFGSIPLQQDMNEFVKEHEEFSRSKVCHLTGIWPRGESHTQPGFILKEIEVVTSKPWCEGSLQDVYDLQLLITSKFSLPQSAMLLSYVIQSGGETTATFLVTQPLVQILYEDMISTEETFFIENGIQSLTVNHEPCFQTPLRKYASYLKDVYNSMSPPTAVNWTPPPSKELSFHLARIGHKISKTDADSFTMSTLRGDPDDIIYNKSPMTYTDICKPADGSKPKLVLLEGAPGVGKTTFAWDVCHRHITGELLEEYLALVLLPLRDNRIRAATSISDLIYHPSWGIQQEVLKEIMHRQGYGLLIILEGWDELPEDLRINASIFLDLVAGNFLCEATIFVTSRPWAAKQLIQDYVERLSQHIEIVGSADQQVSDYMKRELESKRHAKPSQAILFMNYITSNPVIKSLMYTPITRLMIIEVFKAYPERLPKTPTELYRLFTLIVLQRYLTNHPEYGTQGRELNQWTELPKEVEEKFYAVCKLAYDGLQNREQIVFDLKSDFDSLGLMITAHQLHRSKESLASYNFLHLTLQEFLGAVHISCLPQQEQFILIQHYFAVRATRPEYRSESPKFITIFRFLGGLTKHTEPPAELLAQLMRKGKIRVFHWAFESENTALLSKLMGTGEVELESIYSWEPLDFYVSGLCLAQSTNIWKVKFHGSLDDNRMELFVKGCCQESESGTSRITAADFSKNSLTAEGLKEFHLIPARLVCDVKELNFSYNDLDSSACNQIALLLSYMNSLEVLRIDDNPIGEGGAVQLITALGRCSSLKKLSMGETSIGYSDCKSIAQFMLKTDTVRLQELHLQDNNLCTEAVEVIINALAQCRSSLNMLSLSDSLWTTAQATILVSFLSHSENCALETLTLKNCGIDGSSAEMIAAGLRTNSSLLTLDMDKNLIGEDGAQAFAEAIEHNKTLLCLSLESNLIGAKGAKAFAEVLELDRNRTLQNLYLGDNPLGEDGVKALLTAAEHGNTAIYT